MDAAAASTECDHVRAAGDRRPPGVALLRHLPDPVVLVDGEGTLLWANDAAEDQLGWRMGDLAGSSVTQFVHPDDLPTAVASLASVQHKDIGSAVEVRVRDRFGRYRVVEVRGRSALDDPDVGGVVLVLRDLTERRRWEVASGDQALFQAVVDAAPAITMVLESDGRIRGASRALTRLLGHDLESSLGRRLCDLAVAEDRELVELALQRIADSATSWTFEARFDRGDGREPVALGITAVNLLTDRVVHGLVVTATDITSLTDARDALTHLATHDPLTGLPNRAVLRDRLDHALALARRRGTGVAVLFCDLDGFKAVNDTHGHRSGDEVLVEVARRLARVVRGSDTVARLGGDEFVVVVEDDAPETAPDQLGDRIAAAVGAPIELSNGGTASVRVSIGAVTDDGHAIAEALLERADKAMYAAKRRARP